MTIAERLASELKIALKERASERVGVIRFLIAQLYNKSKEKEAHGEGQKLSDEEAVDVLQKEAKRRREAVELFRKGGRSDLVSKEEAELKILEAYLPPPVSREEINSVLDELINRGVKDFNSLMREAMQKFKGRGADGRLIGELIKEKVK